jgi:hypothetical protein
MRRLVLSVLGAAMALLAASFATLSAPAGATGLVDLSVATVSSPAGVSPPGSLAFYTTTFSNDGAIDTAGIFTSDITNGKLVKATASIPGDCSIPTGSPTTFTVSCSTSLAAGQHLTLQVIVQSPLTAPSTITNHSTAQVNPSLVQAIDLVPNNDSTVTTPVSASTGVGSAGFVQEGGTLTYKKHVLTVRDADLGVVAYLNDVTAPATIDCGGEPCAEGLKADYDQSPQFFGTVAIDVDFGTGEPCHGLGADKCHSLFFRKGATMTATPVPACGTQGSFDPCLESLRKDGAGEFHWVVVMQTNDPDLLTPVKSLANVSGA